ncbi:MAG TPA: hypothetical protein VHV57_09610 [Acidimicrobiales bacterium]|jgi:hypothetical protein|nr:hypothetical protein [Acidimicrobiales bacterium]
MATAGTFDGEGNKVDRAIAMNAWIEAARPELEQVAKTYNAVIEYGDLAAKVQGATGFVTKQLVHYWVGDVALGCCRPDEPLLSSLVVDKGNKHVGAGYSEAVTKYQDREPKEDLQMDAAEERLKCYIHFGAELPANGGVPTLPKEVVVARSKAARKAFDEAPRKYCPIHHIQLPRTGKCYDCDD